MDNERKIAAIAWAAHEQGLSYGQLAAQLQARPEGMWKILTDYKAYLQQRRWARELTAKRERAERREEKRRALSLKRRPMPEQRAERQERTGRSVKFDRRAAMALYNKGYSDARIAEELGVSSSAIWHWRKNHCISPNGKREKGGKPSR